MQPFSLNKNSPSSTSSTPETPGHLLAQVNRFLSQDPLTLNNEEVQKLIEKIQKANAHKLNENSSKPSDQSLLDEQKTVSVLPPTEEAPRSILETLKKLNQKE